MPCVAANLPAVRISAACNSGDRALVVLLSGSATGDCALAARRYARNHPMLAAVPEPQRFLPAAARHSYMVEE